MHAKLILLACALCLSACAGAPWVEQIERARQDARLTARLGDGVELRLPTPPGYPEARTLSQIIRFDYGSRSGVIEATLALTPERADIVLTAPAGPRLATIAWTRNGVDVDRTVLAPLDLPVENILADVFVLLWPREAVAQALPAACAVGDADDGGRTLACGGAPLVRIEPDPRDPGGRILRNRALGYVLSISSTP